MPRFITITKSLVLFPAETGDLSQHHVLPRGSYAVEPVPNPLNKKGEPWLRIVGQYWANARPCWEAVSSEPAKTSRPDLRTQFAAAILMLFCLCPSLIALSVKSWRKKPPDLAAMKMELSGLDSEIINLHTHYPLLSSPQQKVYENRRDDAIYSLDIYPRYVAWRNARQGEMLRQQGELDGFITALNTLDEQLYHAWHDWGLTNRPALIAELKRQRARLTSGEVMPDKSQIYASLQTAVLNDAMIEPCLAFSERLEQEITDTDASMRDIARQNRDYADHAIKLNVRIKTLRAQLAQAEKESKSFLTAGKP